MSSLLILCTGNSCRSQMAEGFAKKIFPHFHIESAGTQKHGLNPIAVKVMQEIDIDISKYYSKTVDELKLKSYNYVITVCDNATENCPSYPGAHKIHQSFDDPPALSKNLEHKESLEIYRRVRDEIYTFLNQALPFNTKGKIEK